MNIIGIKDKKILFEEAGLFKSPSIGDISFNHLITLSSFSLRWLANIFFTIVLIEAKESLFPLSIECISLLICKILLIKLLNTSLNLPFLFLSNSSEISDTLLLELILLTLSLSLSNHLETRRFFLFILFSSIESLGSRLLVSGILEL
jgi:hypothetical protein